MIFHKNRLSIKQIILIILWCIYLIFGNAEPILASIHAYPVSANQIMYRSQQSQRDRDNSSWQLVLFKTVNFGKVETLHLRLVGFPGLAEISHPEPLQIATAYGKVWLAEDVLINSSFPANVGEYDFQEVMKELDREMPLWLTVSVRGVKPSGTLSEREALRMQHSSVELVVPPFAVKEWLQLLDK